MSAAHTPGDAPATHTATPSHFVVLIPARLASTRLPNKPLADIAGVPMVVRVANQARRSKADRVAIATDSEEVAAVARLHGHEVIMTRADHASGTERLAEAITLMELAQDTVVVNVQGDEPEIPPTLIDALATTLAADPDCPMATAVHPVQSAADWLNPNVVKVVADADDRALLFSRSPLPWHAARSPGAPSPTATPPGRRSPWRGHCATSACTPTAAAFSPATPIWPPVPWSRSRPWNSCGCSITAIASSCCTPTRRHPPGSTHRPIWKPCGPGWPGAETAC